MPPDGIPSAVMLTNDFWNNIMNPSILVVKLMLPYLVVNSFKLSSNQANVA